MTISIFLSTVTDEFRAYRDQLRGDLTRHNVAVKVQEDFKGLGGSTLDKLDIYIAHCDAVVHLVGDMTGSAPALGEVSALLRKHMDMAAEFPPLAEAIRDGTAVSYTQWEAWLALYHGKFLLTAQAESAAPRDARHAPTAASRAAQAAHLGRLQLVNRHPDCTFANVDVLAKHIAFSGIVDLLVKDYARQAAAERDVALGFIDEMAGQVSKDPTLDLDGKKQAVSIAIEIYTTELAGGLTQTNFGAIVDTALANAKRLTDEGKYRSAMAEALHGDRRDARRDLLIAEGDTLAAFRDQRGSNVHLIAVIAVRRAALALAVGPDEIGADRNRLGNALSTLGKRESGTTRLDEAVAAYRAALEERTSDRVPLDWTFSQHTLANALVILAERTHDRTRMTEAIAAMRNAAEVYRQGNNTYWLPIAEQRFASMDAALAKMGP